MPSQFVTILDSQRTVVATAQVAGEGSLFSGSADVARMPAALRSKFEEYEALVNDQVFGQLDEIEEQIAAISYVAVFEDGSEVSVADLQIYPKSGTVSFQTVPGKPGGLESAQPFEQPLSKVKGVELELNDLL